MVIQWLNAPGARSNIHMGISIKTQKRCKRYTFNREGDSSLGRN